MPTLCGQVNGWWVDIAGVSTKAPSSQWRQGAVTSRMLISGLKLVANGLPWSPPLTSMMSRVWISSKWCLSAHAVKTLVTPGSKPEPSSAERPAARKRSWKAHCHEYSKRATSGGS